MILDYLEVGLGLVILGALLSLLFRAIYILNIND